ncbi:VOC family protein [Longimicrobium sp.]|uniref:VOC family protein n=1 Tax=Longimicrobium sp. TaxID=2029185 RepID=UPI002E2FED9C|nr:VOC family protein [Longimicrobium sp.]HEX6040560.1 VOC family protein [Longimicrobium sp.]
MTNLDQHTATVSADPGYGIAPRGYRLPASVRLGHVTLQVADLARSLAYYRDVLGLRVAEQGPGTATLTAHGDDAPLVVLREKPGAAPVPRRGRLGLYHFAILLPNREALGRFVAHLARIGERAGASDHFVSEALYLQDPDGLGIEVYADRPRAQWRSQDRQLVMATEPLDLQGLVNAAGGAPWTGMPAGTVIGHVHLYVGDIDAAAAFYHEGLGLDKVVWSYPGALFLSAGGYHHHLGVNTWAAGAAPATDNDARLLEWQVVVPSTADATASLDSLATTGRAVMRDGDGGTARDPWGTTVYVRAG